MTAATSSSASPSSSSSSSSTIAAGATDTTTTTTTSSLLATFAFTTFGIAACAALPARVVIASEQGAGLGRLLYLIGGLAGDVAVLSPFFGLLFLLPLRRRSVVVVAAVAVVVFLLLSNGAAEFRVDRGVFPGPIDIREGTGHHDFLAAELPAVLAGRFLWMNLLSSAVATWLLLRVPPRESGRLSRRRALLLSSTAWLIVFFGARQGHAYCASIQNADALASPTGALLTATFMSGTLDGSPQSTRGLLSRYRGGSSAADVALGAQQTGIAPEIRRSLDEQAPSELIAAARAASASIFKDAPPIIFHVSLESMRADDIHTLVADAPPELTPFLNDVVYAEPRSSSSNIAAFAHAHQSGIRTSQAIGGMMCGVGAMPFNLSIARDLGVLPLRCLPDVLVDAGLVGHVFYGHDFVFDDMATFFRAHHLTNLHGRETFDHRAAPVPHGVWRAVSDAAVYDAALARHQDPKQGAYNFVLTLSHHAPYTEPEDFSPRDKAAIGTLCETRSLHGDNCARLRTLRYADQALAQFMAKIEASPDADRTIVIVSGDHTVHQWVPWTSPNSPEPQDGITRVPFFVRAPRAIAANEEWSRLQQLAKTTPISNADLPALVLALVDAPLRARLAQDSRWHTLGGSRVTSPHASSLHGIDAHGVPFEVSPAGVVQSTGITMQGLKHESDVMSPLPRNRPAVAFWSDFLRRPSP